MIDPKKLLQLEQQHGLPNGLLSAVMMAESEGNPNAIGPETKYGTAKGPFQFIDDTAKAYGVNQFDEESSAAGAAKMFSDLSRQYGGDVPKMLAGYNWGSGNMQKHGMENMPAETRNYINKVTQGMGREVKIVPTANEMTVPIGRTIKFPNGKVLKNVPNDLTKEQIQQKLAESGRLEEFGISIPEQQEPESITRQIGRAGRSTLTGMAGFADIPVMIARGGAGLAAGLGNAALGTNVSNLDVEGALPLPSDITRSTIDRFTNNKLAPRGAMERVTDDASQALAGTGSGLAMASRAAQQAANPLNRAVSRVLAERPGMAGVAALSGAGAAGTTREQGGGPVAQTVAGLAGGVAGGFSPMGARTAARSAKAGAQNTYGGISARTPEELEAASQAIKQSSSELYRQSREAGALIHKNRGAAIINKIDSSLSGGKLNARLHGDTMSVLKDMRKLKSQPLSLEELDQYRQLLGQVAQKNTDPLKGANPDARLATMAIDALDDEVEKLQRIDIIGGKVEAVDALNAGREEWKRYRKFEAVANIIKQSDGDPNRLKSNLQRFVNKPKNMRGMTTEEKTALREAARNTVGEKLLKAFGKFGFDLGSSLTPGNTALPALTTGGAMLGLGTTPLVVGGTLARQLQKLVGRGKAEQVLKLIEGAQ